MAHATHWTLYALMTVQPFIGWIATSAFRAPIPVFALFELPPIWPQDRAFSDRLFAFHALIAGELLVIIANRPSLGVLLSTDQDQSDMASATAIIIVILILGIIVDQLFGVADRGIRRRWGLTGTS